MLSDGVLLCKTLAKLRPDLQINVDESGSYKGSIQNAQSFLTASQVVGVPKNLLFEKDDLVNSKNLNKILMLFVVLAHLLSSNDPTLPVVAL